MITLLQPLKLPGTYIEYYLMSRTPKAPVTMDTQYVMSHQVPAVVKGY